MAAGVDGVEPVSGKNAPRAMTGAPPKLVSQWNEIPTADQRTLRMHARVGRGNGGGKPALILVPGLVVTSRNVGPTAEWLQDAFSVYALDLPGFGKSDKPARMYWPSRNSPRRCSRGWTTPGCPTRICWAIRSAARSSRRWPAARRNASRASS